MTELGASVGNAQLQPPLPGVLPRGTMLRGYEVTSVLGKGGFGITYRAVDTTLHRDVAIKEYLPTALAMRDATGAGWQGLMEASGREDEGE